MAGPCSTAQHDNRTGRTAEGGVVSKSAHASPRPTPDPPNAPRSTRQAGTRTPRCSHHRIRPWNHVPQNPPMPCVRPPRNDGDSNPASSAGLLGFRSMPPPDETTHGVGAHRDNRMDSADPGAFHSREMSERRSRTPDSVSGSRGAQAQGEAPNAGTRSTPQQAPVPRRCGTSQARLQSNPRFLVQKTEVLRYYYPVTGHVLVLPNRHASVQR